MSTPLLPTIKETAKTDWKAGFQALKFLPRFFAEIRQSSPGLFILNFLSRLSNSFTPILVLWVGKLIVDEIVLQISAKSPNYHQLWIYVGMEVGLVVVSDIISRMDGLSDGLLGDKYSNDSSVKIIKKAGELNISHLEDSAFYDKLERARTQTNSRVNLMSNAFSQIQDIIIIATLVVGLVFFEPWLIVMLLLSIIPSFINEIKFSSSRYSLARSWTAERRELDYLRYIGANDKTAMEMKLFGLTDYIADRFKRLSDQYYTANKTLAVQRSIYGGLFNILGILSYYGAYVLIIYRVLHGAISLGELTFLSASFNRLRNNLQSTFTRFTRISESALYLKDYFDYLDLNIEEPESAYLPLPTKIKQGFEFNNVKFSYPGQAGEVLKGVNFKLDAGEKMAFVGENGAGKTTLIKLLLRFYEPTSGEILLDGINIQRFERKAYQKMFGVIFQDFVRYEFTVKENIGMGNIDQLEDRSKITQAAELSLATEVIRVMEDGYEQQLGKRFARGKDLSGGQWQKIALARAYMKDAEVMILDEPTSALDARAEHEVFQRFIGLTKGKTSIIISHRFSTVRMADRIIVLKDGQIHEMGSHEELLNNGQLYSELFDLQAVGYQ